MRITVRFMDGAVEEFDTNALTTDSTLGRTNALTDLRVTLGDGLWVEASWYWVPQADEDAGEAPLVHRTLGCPLHVPTGGEVEAVRSIELNGRLQWMRIGPDLCDMVALDERVDLMHDRPQGAELMNSGEGGFATRPVAGADARHGRLARLRGESVCGAGHDLEQLRIRVHCIC